MLTTTNEKGLDAANTEALGDKQQHTAQLTDDLSAFQEIAGRMGAFNRLQRAFDAIGWNLHPLTGDSVIAVHRHWAMHSVCPDLRAARELLKRVGGIE